MIATNLFEPTDAHEIVSSLGRYSILEYKKDYSTSTGFEAMSAYYASKMNRHKRQVIIEMNSDGEVYLQAGAMQLTMGPIDLTVKPKKITDVVKQYFGSKVTEETMFKPKYSGRGLILLEPTYKYILLQDLDDWNGSMVIEDGMFLACDATCEMHLSGRKNISSTLLGGEGFFNNMLTGSGVVALESPVPPEELIIADLEDDMIRIDGDMAIAWSGSLQFTVETATGTLVGSKLSDEGFVNVYRGTGRVMIAPVGKALGETKRIAEKQTDKPVGAKN